MTKTQYALIDKTTGEYATLTHQDDLETPLVDITLPGLFNLCDIWSDIGVQAFLEELRDGGEYDKYEIVKEEVKRVDLNENDLQLLSKCLDPDQGKEDDDEADVDD